MQRKEKHSLASQLLNFVQSAIPNTTAFTVPHSLHGIEPRANIKHMDYLDSLGYFILSAVSRSVANYTRRRRTSRVASFVGGVPVGLLLESRAHQDFASKNIQVPDTKTILIN